MKLSDDDLAIVRSVIQYAGPEMDPDDQAFYLQHCALTVDRDSALAELEIAGVIEMNDDEIPVLTAAAIEAAAQS